MPSRGSAARAAAVARLPLRVLCLDLSALPAWAQFAACCAGVMSCYLAYSVLQESVLSLARADGVHLGWFLTMTQFCVYSITMVLAQLLCGGHDNSQNNDKIDQIDRTTAGRGRSGPACLRGAFRRTAPLASYARLGLLSVGTIGLANQACEYLNMPVAQVLKSSKIIPVMLLGRLILGRTYSALHYVAVLLISTGLSVFIVADTQVQPVFSVLGLMLMCGSLVADALIGNYQERLFKTFPAMSTSENMMWTKLFGMLASAFVCVASGSFGPVFRWVVWAPHTHNVMVRMLAFGVVGVVGENFIMGLVKRFGAVATVTTTTVRKGFSLVLSFVLFPKPFNVGYVLGAGIMLCGVGMNVALKNEALAARVWAVCRGSRGEGSGGEGSGGGSGGREIELENGIYDDSRRAARRRTEFSNFIV